jgi:hypothetical protein
MKNVADNYNPILICNYNVLTVKCNIKTTPMTVQEGLYALQLLHVKIASRYSATENQQW